MEIFDGVVIAIVSGTVTGSMSAFGTIAVLRNDMDWIKRVLEDTRNSVARAHVRIDDHVKAHSP